MFWLYQLYFFFKWEMFSISSFVVYFFGYLKKIIFINKQSKSRKNIFLPEGGDVGKEGEGEIQSMKCGCGAGVL